VSGHEFIQDMMEKRLTEMTDAEFNDVVARTRAPKLDPKEQAANAIRGHLGKTD